jgi:hypothetical protein
MDTIKMDLLEIGLSVLDWIGLAQDRYSSCKLGNEPSGSIKCWELPNGCTTFGLPSGTRLCRVSYEPSLLTITAAICWPIGSCNGVPHIYPGTRWGEFL